MPVTKKMMNISSDLAENVAVVTMHGNGNIGLSITIGRQILNLMALTGKLAASPAIIVRCGRVVASLLCAPVAMRKMIFTTENSVCIVSIVMPLPISRRSRHGREYIRQ